MKKRFSYLEKGGQHFPIIDVKLINRKEELVVKALVDSGASYSVFRPEIAQVLKIDLEKGKKIFLTGIGGRIMGYLHNITVTLGNKKFICKIIFSNEINVSFNLLGRDNFFTPFVISFFEKNKTIVIRNRFGDSTKLN